MAHRHPSARFGARRFIAAGAVVAAAAALSACGGSDDTADESGSADPQTSVGALAHVHGLGVNPSDDALIIATHTGLFRSAEGDRRAQPYGDSRQDVMGFSVLGPDRFVGSGHPAADDTSLPPNLGLIRSSDAGRTWKPVALLGEADFHVLESTGRTVYGFDGTQGRLMVSDDGGSSFEQRTSPAPMFDLAIDPSDADRAVAATEAGLFGSRDAGERWRPLRDDLAGLLAWPGRDRLYLVDGSGTVQVSTDQGERWQPAGSIGGQPAAFVAYEDELYAALSDGTIKRSTDRGATWQVRATP